MPRIPYTATSLGVEPEVSPRVSAPRFDVAVSPEMFGANVGAAAQHFGVALGEVGNEVMGVATKLQDINNQAEARQLTTELQDGLAPDRAQFKTTEQKAATDGLIPYLDQSRDKYNAILAKASNPIVRQYFQRDAAFWMRSNTAEASDHAAAEGRKYTLGTIRSASTSLIAQVAQNPFDQNNFDYVKSSLTQHEIDAGRLDGLGPDDPNVQNAVHAQISAATKMRIVGALKTNAEAGSKMLNDAIANHEIQGRDLEEAQSFVASALDKNGAVQVAGSILNGNYWSTRTIPGGVARIAVGTFETGNNYGARGVQTAHGIALGRYQVMSDFLPGFLREAGMKVVSPEAFLADPHMQDQLFDTLFDKYQKEGGSFGAAVNRWFTGSYTPEPTRHDALGTTAAKYRAVTSSIVGQVMSRLRGQMSEKQSADAARAEAERISPGNQGFADRAVNQTLYQRNLDKRVQQDDINDSWDHMSRGVLDYYNAHGQLPQDIESLRQTMPDFDAQYSRLDAKNQLKLQNTLSGYSRQTRVMTNEQYKNYSVMADKLKYGTPEEQEEMLNTSAYSQPWPISFMEKFRNLQGRIKANREAFPQTNRAMQIIDPIIADPNIGIQKGSDDYRMIRELTEDRLEDYSRVYGKPMPPEEVRKLAGQLTYEVKHGIWGFGRETFIQQNPPPEAYDAIKAAIEKRGLQATDENVRRVYLHQLLRDATQKPKQEETLRLRAQTEGVPTLPMSQ